LEDGHNDANEQFVASGLFGDRNMLTDMVEILEDSASNLGWSIAYKNYIVNIIITPGFVHTQSLGTK